MNRFRSPAAVAVALGVLSALAILSTACGGPDDEIVATWDGGRLTRADYDDYRLFHELDDSPQVVRELVFVLCMADACRQDDGGNDPFVRFALESMRHRVLVAALRASVQDAVIIPDDEVEAVRLQDPDAFVRPSKIRLRNIYKRLPGGAGDDAVRRTMAELRAQLEAGADFGELAERESESQSRFRQGRLGLVDPDQMAPEAGAAVRDLSPGEISPPVEFGNGLTIFQCEEVREATIPTEDEARAIIRNTLWRQQREEAWKEFQTDFFAGFEPTIRPDSTDTVIELDDYRLTAGELVSLVPARLPGRRLEDLPPAQLNRLLKTWIGDHLMAQAAMERGLDQTPETSRALRWHTEAVYARTELGRRVAERLDPPTEEQLRERYEKQPERFHTEAVFELSAIQFAGPGLEDQRAAVALASDVARQVESGRLEFADAAAAHSIHPSAARGGALGRLPRGQILNLGPVANRAIRNLTPGETTGLLRMEDGLWVFKLTAFEAERPLTFEAARATIQQEYLSQATRAAEHAVRDEYLDTINLQPKMSDSAG